MVYKDSKGRYRTLSLFLELASSSDDGFLPVYTLSEQGRDDLPSAYLIYMSVNTEYEAAKLLVGSWLHWKKLLNCKPFLEYLVEWREEKEKQLQSIGINGLLRAATEEKNPMAARWLAEKGWKDNTKTKKENKSSTDNSDKILHQITSDYNRLTKNPH